MTARSGMSTLILRWRRMVSDTGTAIWTDDQAQQLLDTHRTDLWGHELTPVPRYISGTTQYLTYASTYADMETADSGTAVIRVYDANGSVIGTSNYTADWQRGIFTFTADQQGSARYIDGHSFDLNSAAADGWRELMSSKASLYRFTADGASYDRQQWFEHCQQMARYYDGLSKPTFTTLERIDLA